MNYFFKGTSEYDMEYRWIDSFKSCSFKPTFEQAAPVAGLESIEQGCVIFHLCISWYVYINTYVLYLVHHKYACFAVLHLLTLVIVQFYCWYYSGNCSVLLLILFYLVQVCIIHPTNSIFFSYWDSCSVQRVSTMPIYMYWTLWSELIRVFSPSEVSTLWAR